MVPHTTTSLRAYSTLLLQIGALILSVPAVVLPNNNYTLLIGTSLLKNYGVNICHKNNEFTILGHSVPLKLNHLSTQMQQPMTVNLTEPNISTELIQEQAAEVKLLMKKYQKVFSQGNHDLGFAVDVRHYIDTEDQRPICLKPIRRSAQA